MKYCEKEAYVPITSLEFTNVASSSNPNFKKEFKTLPTTFRLTIINYNNTLMFCLLIL